MPGRRRFPLFDSLRALAALCVLGAHTAFVSGAVYQARYSRLLDHLTVGVAIFFVISGFLLYRPFVAARLGGGERPRVGRYALRRAVRVLPPYWAALVCLALFPGLYGVATGNWWVYGGLLQYYPVYRPGAECAAQVRGCGLTQSWTLTVEIAFYALLPVYAVGLHRVVAGRDRRRQLQVEAGALLVLSALSVATHLVTVRTYPKIGWLNVTVAVTFAWFAVGMALAVASVALSGRERTSRSAGFVVNHPLACWVAAAVVYVALCLLLPPLAIPRRVTFLQDVAAYLGFALVALLVTLPAVFGDDAGGLPRRVLRTRGMSWLGRISYGLFLWHLAVAFELARRGALDWMPGRYVGFTALTLAVTVPPAAASWYLLERPLMRLFYRSRPVRAPATDRRGEVADGEVAAADPALVGP